MGEAATLRVENYGDSELARRYGVTRYPAIFVDDVLVATPKDFGFYGGREGEGEGRYAPIRNAASQERFRADLRRAIELVAAGRKEAARALAPDPAEPALPPLADGLSFVTLGGRTVARADLAGKVVVVEHWATWCPPCRGTLAWLAKVAARHPEQLAVVAVAVESDREDVEAFRRELGDGVLWTLETPELSAAFGAVTAVPTLRLYDRSGAAASAHFGAPPDLHTTLEAQLARLLEAPAAGTGG